MNAGATPSNAQDAQSRSFPAVASHAIGFAEPDRRPLARVWCLSRMAARTKNPVSTSVAGRRTEARQLRNDMSTRKIAALPCCSGGPEKPIKSAASEGGHDWVACNVVPDKAHGLCECPRLAALPLRVVAAKVFAQNPSRSSFEQMPGTNEVKRGISRADVFNINDARKAPTCHQHVARDQIAVGHNVPVSASRHCPQHLPHLAKSRHVQQSLAAREAGVHPLVLGRQLASASRACEGPATSVDGPDAADELSKVMSKGDRPAWVSLAGDDARYPGLHRPGERIAEARLAQSNGLRSWKARAPGQFPGCLRF